MTRFDYPLVVHDLNSFLLLPTDAGVAGLGAAVSVSAGDAWVVSARAGKSGHLSSLGRTLGENAGASGQKTTNLMA